MNLSWFDILVIVIVMAGAFSGMSKGLIRQLLSVIGLVGCIILAGQRYQSLGLQLTFISDPKAAEVIAFVLIFFGVIIAANLLGTILHRVSKIMLFGFMDQLAGLAFGALEAVVIIQLALLLLLKFSLIGQFTFIYESTLGTTLLSYAPFVLGLLPTDFSGILKLIPGI
jgi:membrane protein required for colicin V production